MSLFLRVWVWALCVVQVWIPDPRSLSSLGPASQNSRSQDPNIFLSKPVLSSLVPVWINRPSIPPAGWAWNVGVPLTLPLLGLPHLSTQPSSPRVCLGGCHPYMGLFPTPQSLPSSPHSFLPRLPVSRVLLNQSPILLPLALPSPYTTCIQSDLSKFDHVLLLPKRSSSSPRSL